MDTITWILSAILAIVVVVSTSWFVTREEKSNYNLIYIAILVSVGGVYLFLWGVNDYINRNGWDGFKTELSNSIVSWIGAIIIGVVAFTAFFIGILLKEDDTDFEDGAKQQVTNARNKNKTKKQSTRRPGRPKGSRNRRNR